MIMELCYELICRLFISNIDSVCVHVVLSEHLLFTYCITYSLHILSCRTALHWASKRGHLSLVKLLLSYGADTNITNDKGKTPLEVSTDDRVVELLGGLLSCVV